MTDSFSRRPDTHSALTACMLRSRSSIFLGCLRTGLVSLLVTPIGFDLTGIRLVPSAGSLSSEIEMETELTNWRETDDFIDIPFPQGRSQDISPQTGGCSHRHFYLILGKTRRKCGAETIPYSARRKRMLGAGDKRRQMPRIFFPHAQKRDSALSQQLSAMRRGRLLVKVDIVFISRRKVWLVVDFFFSPKSSEKVLSSKS